MKKNMLLLLSVAVLLSACSGRSGIGSIIKPNYDKAYQDYVSLGAQYLQMGRYNLAESRLKRAIEINSQPAEAWNALAVLYEQTRDIASGYQVYQKLIQSHPDYTLGFMNFATFLCKFNREPELQTLYQQMRNKGKDFATLSYISEGNCAIRKNNPAAAMNAYQRAIQNDPYAPGALLPLAKLSLDKRDAARALQYIGVIHTYVGYSPESVALGIQAARMVGDKRLESDLSRIMRASYAQSPEAQSLGI